jgi:hypothetical protein
MEIFFPGLGHFFAKILITMIAQDFFALFRLSLFEIHLPKLYILDYLDLIGDRAFKTYKTAGK